MPSVKVEELGEFELIRRISRWVLEGSRPSGDLCRIFGNPLSKLSIGIGDDAAAWQADNLVQLWTTDTMVDGVHFHHGQLDWAAVGWKIMAANISDIAAMGGAPRYAMVTLGLPRVTLVEEVERLYQGMLQAGNKHGVIIAGGDVVRSSEFFVTVALAGVAGQALMIRSEAKRGDLVAISGYPGLSAGGLRLILDRLTDGSSVQEVLQEAHSHPEPQVKLGWHLMEAGVRAAIDTSDGLVDDLGKMCLASNVAARIEQPLIPVHSALREVFPDAFTDMILSGGEDYQLLFTASSVVMDQVAKEGHQMLTTIGTIVEGEPGEVTIVDAYGYEVNVSIGGWDHFRS